MRRTKKSLAKASWQVSKSAYQQADKGFTHFAKWVTTDHTSFSRAMAEMPKMGFIDSIKYILTHFVIMLIRTFISMLLIFILIAFGIPLLIQFLLH